MISNGLQSTFTMMEALIYPAYEKADKKEREKICRDLAKIEAKMMMDEIDEEIERRCKNEI